VMLPSGIVVDDDDPSTIDTFRVDSCVVNGTIANSEFDRPRAASDWSIAGGTTTVPVEFDGDVVIEAKLNGKGPFAFILDTGGHDILTVDAARTLGLKPEGAGSSGGAGEGRMPEQFARVERLQIGGLTLRDQSFFVM